MLKQVMALGIMAEAFAAGSSSRKSTKTEPRTLGVILPGKEYKARKKRNAQARASRKINRNN